MQNILIVIPDRFGSQRFPGKPLAKLGEKPVIQWVYEAAFKAGHPVVVATDDDRIYNTVNNFGGEVVMTSKDHPSGTDRCLEAVIKYIGDSKPEPDIVLNIQGDEPFINEELINLLSGCFHDTSCEIATLLKEINPEKEKISDTNKVKAVRDANGYALYFSRLPIPFRREETYTGKYFHHIGVYGFRFSVLKSITRLPQSMLEQSEKLEQLRWLENGFKIKTAITNYESIGIDTPEDLENANLKIRGGI